MKKLTPIIILIVIVIAIAGAGYYFSKNSQGVAETSEDVKELGKLLQAEGTTGVDLLNQAVADGRLDNETAIIYKMYSIFGDENLPEEYTSNKLLYEGNSVVYEAILNFETYSKETQEKLEPFLKRPDEKGSYFNLKYQDAVVAEKTSGLIPAAHAIRPNVGIYTEFLISKDDKVKVWYPKVDTNTRDIFGTGNTPVSAVVAKTMAEKILKYLDQDEIVKEFENLLNKSLMSDGTKGGDSRLDIYVTPTGLDLAVTYGENATPCASHILMSIGLANKDNVLKTTLAHEIFHSFQYVYKYDTTKDNWYGEATAVWSEDYIYPATNTEHEWVDHFLPRPEVTLYKESPPDDHHYAAYVFPYFLTEYFGDDVMRKSWEGCENQPCIKGIDESIEGGLKKQFKEFTLWNYNKEPAQYYMDIGAFPLDSSVDGPNVKVETIMTEETKIEIEEIAPLAADLSKVFNDITEDDDIKKLTFTDLQKFTSKTDKAGIKAVIYYKDGRQEIEDWTDKRKRSFCIENKEENFEKIILIYSNAQKEKSITETKIKVEGKDNCYQINQHDNTSSVIHFPYSDGGVYKTVDINNSIEIKSEGETVDKSVKEQKYEYLTTWKLYHEFEQIRQTFSPECDGTTLDFEAGWTTRSAGNLEFDLTGLKDGDNFSIDLHYGLPHPNGNYEVVPAMQANCISTSVVGGSIDLTGITGTVKNIWQGKIFDMTEDGAKIQIPNCCLYNSCSRNDGAKFQTIADVITLEIKKTQ